MNKQLEVLIIDDSEDDAQLLELEFRHQGLASVFNRVDTREALISSLEKKAWDIALCDYFIPSFSGLDALRIIRERSPDLPVIFVSGRMGEEAAVEAMRAGANDYVMKDKLRRLIPAVKRELLDYVVRLERKRAEEALRKMTRMYAMLSEINKTIIHHPEPQRLFEATCEIAVNKGGFLMAWVGRVNNDTSKIEVVASKGVAGDYLARINIDLADPERSSGPVGIAVRTKTHVVCNDILHDEGMSLWREAAIKNGYGSLAAFPLIVFGEVWGSLALYNHKSNFFSDDESLIDELVKDISFGIETHVNEQERKQAEAERIKSDSKYRALFEQAGDYIFLMHVSDEEKGPIIFEANNAAFKKHGYGREEMIGMPVAEFETPTARAQLRDRMSLFRTAGDSAVFETEHSRKDGTTFFIEVSAMLVQIGEDAPFILSIERDITERKKAEIAIQNSEMRYKRLVESVADYIYTISIENNLPTKTFHGPACISVTGYSSEEYDADPLLWHKMIHDEDKKYAMDQIGKVFSTEIASSFDHRIIHKTGAIRWVTNTIVPRLDESGRLIAYDGLIQNITEPKYMENKIIALIRLYSVLSKINEAIVRIREPQELYEQVCRIIIEDGLFRMAWVGLVEQATGLIKPIAWQGHNEGYLDGIKISIRGDIPEGLGPTGTAVRENRCNVCNDWAAPRMSVWNKEGLKRGYRSSIALPLVLDNTVIGALTIYSETPNIFVDEELQLLESLAADISFSISAIEHEKKRRAAEHSIKLSEEKYRTLFEESFDGLFITSPTGKILDINKKGVSMFGYESKEEMMALDLERDVYANPPDRKRILAMLAEQGSAEYEVVVKKKSGETMVAICALTAVRNEDENTTSYRGIIRDITEKKKLEKELMEAKRMEIIGQLAGGVAHEVRNPLNAILSVSEALFKEDEIAHNPEYQPYIGHIRAQVGRLSQLMNELLDLGRPAKQADIMRASLSDICSDTLNLWNASDAAREHLVVFSCDTKAESPYVFADIHRLQQVLMNLIENAAQHSPGNSSIYLCITGPEKGKVAILIRDSGKGIGVENLEKIFEPFYTTRRTGTGLGLTLVKHFIESMGGEIAIWNNEPPPGCTAQITLKVATGE